MATNCLNCGTPVNDKYCSHCGQKITVGRLTWHHVVEEAAHFFTHIEHSFLGTTKELLIRPGRLQKSFVDGKRKTYHKPISFLLVWIAIFLVITGLAGKFAHFEEVDSSTFIASSPEIGEMIVKYNTLIEVMILPFTALNLWLQLARPKLTYFEVLITGFYRFSALYIFLTVYTIFGWIFGFNPGAAVPVYTLSVIYTVWIVFVFYDFFKRYNIKNFAIRMTTTITTGIIIYLFMRNMIAKLFIAWSF
jgi:hypothetical protein